MQEKGDEQVLSKRIFVITAGAFLWIALMCVYSFIFDLLEDRFHLLDAVVQMIRDFFETW